MRRREFLTVAAVPCTRAATPAFSRRAPAYDLVLKGGHVIDVANGINRKMDVAVQAGKIARVDANIASDEAKTAIGVSGQ